MAKLFLMRHGLSEWNKLGQWTGWTDVDLAPEGKEEARATARLLKEYEIQSVHTSTLKRAQQTFDEVKDELGWTHIEAKANNALNERDYGIYTGKVKEQVRAEVGDEEYKKIRRGWSHPIPEGESLKVVYERIVPYFQEHILPELKMGKNVLVVAHGNSLRALAKYLENIDDVTIADVQIATGEVYCYSCDDSGKVLEKEIKGSKLH